MVPVWREGKPGAIVVNDRRGPLLGPLGGEIEPFLHKWGILGQKQAQWVWQTLGRGEADGRDLIQTMGLDSVYLLLKEKSSSVFPRMDIATCNRPIERRKANSIGDRR